MKWRVVTDNPKSRPKRPPNFIGEDGYEHFYTGVFVLVTDADGKVYVATYDFQNGGYFWWRDSLTPIKVVAWMPLPKPYKQGGQNNG